MSLQTLGSLALVLISVYPLKAATHYVGSCHASSFATINDAINSSTVAPGSIIKVCPGTYPEQVIISKPLTLEGTPGAGVVLITGPGNPSMRTTVSPISNTTLAPYVWITAGPVKIQDIAVTDESGTTAEDAEFYFATGAFGTLSRVSSQGFTIGTSVWAENAAAPNTSVTIENSYLGNGIVALAPPQPAREAPLLEVKITGNQIVPNLPSGSGLGDGLYLYEVSGAVSGNSVFGPQTSGHQLYNGVGIWDQSPGITVADNNIMFAELSDGTQPFYVSYGIVVASDMVSVKSNKISGASYGMDLGCHVGSVSDNTPNRSNVGLIDVASAFTGTNTIYNSSKPTSAGVCN